MGGAAALDRRTAAGANKRYRARDGAGMNTLPDSTLKKIAKATGVDDPHYAKMQLSVRTAVLVATEMWRAKQTDFCKAPITPLVEVSQAVRHLLQKIGALDSGQMRMLQVCLEDEADEDGGGDLRTHEYKAVQEYKTLIHDLGQAADKAVGVHQWNSSRRRPGAPRGPRNYPFRFLVGRLRTAIEFEATGRLTYERKTEGGTLVKVLELLRPHVDEGLIPDPLPWSALEQITSRKTKK